MTLLNRLSRLLLVVLLLGSLLYTVHPWFDAKNDSSMYVATRSRWKSASPGRAMWTRSGS